ncbi:MAG: SUMF1/EgtB/PvdO family nonheme iron enzyme [Phycisphaerales bacterium]|nr:MAG: SUMF1/EgtB/PvdO family nonheme iron enzyme [Phycisphaerales bacterium]
MWRRISSIVMALIVIAVSGILCFAACPRADLTGDCRVDFNDFAVMASEWLTEGIPVPQGMVWVYIDDPGVPGHEGFHGYMSKYETTNAQYCEYLNAALASGDIIVAGSDVKGANGSNSGEDFVGQVYYDLAGPGATYNGATNGGAARINWTGSSFTVDSGFENHPVTYVSWYGSTAFCDYYGWRLPSEWEWQAVADFHGSYTYACGTSTNNSIANYRNSTHPHGTTEVGAFGAYGYGLCDMAGNVYEWMENWYSEAETTRCLRGGSWPYGDSNLRCSYRLSVDPGDRSSLIGFRVVFSQS